MTKLPKASIKKEKNFEAIDKKIEEKIGDFASLTPPAKEKFHRVATEKQVLTLEIPLYVWKQLKLINIETKEPMRTITLRAYKAIGIEVDEEELKDQRKNN